MARTSTSSIMSSEEFLNDSSSHPSSFSKRKRISKELKQRLSLDDPGNDVKRNTNVQQLTINKLHYEKIELLGRDNEVGILNNCFKRLTAAAAESKRQKEMLFIKGYSGTGKTTLVSTLEDKVTSNKSGVFVLGKFESNNEEPYAAISVAFGEICRIAEDTFECNGEEEAKEDRLRTIGNELISELGMEVELLMTLVPELEAIVTTSTFDDKSLSGDNNVDLEAGQEKIKYCFRVLTRVLSTHLSPMVIVLDDLQWTDVSSLEVIDCLITDVQNPNPLMLLGCYRSNKVDAKHILSSKIDELSEKKKKFSFNMTEIELESLNAEQVNQIAMSMLSIDDEDKTQPLAEVCFKRTLGNPFFTIEFIRMLDDEMLINFNLGLLRWIWDVKAIEDATMATVNVVDLLKARMRKLSRPLQLLLQYAACLGSTFTLSILSLVWSKLAIANISELPHGAMLPGMLLLLEEGNFIEGCGVDQYRWVHDKVQKAGLSLGDAAKASFQFEIGSILFHALEGKELDANLFDITNLINKGNIKRRPDFAQLNLRAAIKARSIAAFHSGSLYVASGIRLLPYDKKWTTYRKLTLQLFTVGAEMELALGRINVVDNYIDEVISREDCTILEKLPLYAVRSHKLNIIDCSYQEASGLIKSNLKELGVTMYHNRVLQPFQVMSSFLSCVKKTKRISVDDILAIKTTKDAEQRAIMVLLRKLAVSAFLSSNTETAFLSSNKLMYLECSTKIVQMTLKTGINDMAGVAFTALGLATVAVLGDFEAASHLGEVGVAIQKKFSAEYSEATTMHVAHTFVFPWRKPLLSSLAPLLAGYMSGMRSGNIDRGLWCRTMHDIILPYMLGKQLSTIEQKCYICVSQNIEANQSDQVLIIKMVWQVILNLMRKSNNEIEMRGMAFDEKELGRKMHAAMLPFFQSELLVFFGKFERAAELALERGDDYKKAIPAVVLIMQETFHRGVALYAMARKTRKRRFKKPAEEIRKTIKGWMDQGNPNVRHYYLFLSAEQAALDKDYKPAHEQYKNAIIFAAKTGRMQHAALFSERYSDFLLHRKISDEEEGRYRLEQAIRYYKDWGAEAKVQQLTRSLN